MLETSRLILRHWTKADRLPFREMNADSRVMEYFPAPLSAQESDALADRIEKELLEKDYGLWAAELKETGEFIGFVGLHYQDFEAPFTPCIEIGWRLAFAFWGKGYATEAAKEVLSYAFSTLAPISHTLCRKFRLDVFSRFQEALAGKVFKPFQKSYLEYSEKQTSQIFPETCEKWGLGLAEIFSFTAKQNSRSRKVMEKIGMQRGEDFEHSRLKEGHPLRLHVLYQIKKEMR